MLLGIYKKDKILHISVFNASLSVSVFSQNAQGWETALRSILLTGVELHSLSSSSLSLFLDIQTLTQYSI